MSDRSRLSAGPRMEPESKTLRPQLSDEQWALIRDLFKPPMRSPLGGRPRVDPRACLEGVLWVLRRRTCRGASHRTRPVGVASSSGRPTGHSIGCIVG